MPEGFENYRTVSFTDETVPAGLLNDHDTKRGVWGEVRVIEGSLQYVCDDLKQTINLGPGEHAVIVPEVKHRVAPAGGTTFEVAFFRAPKP